MNYITLKKMYYKNNDEYNKLYEQRFAEGIKLDLLINDNPAFFVEDVEIYKRITNILRINEELTYLINALPGIAKSKYANKCLIDEIVLTNDIEGVRSTRKELGDILDDLGARNKRNRFYGLVMEYAALQSNAKVSLTNSQDIRNIYDILFLEEVKTEDPEDVPDGIIFRKGSVSVIKGTQKTIHEGLVPEEKIIDYMEKSLKVLKDESIDILIRTSIFHYLFGYIHPFYEANGRMSRFISSYILSKNLCNLIGYCISYYIKEHISDYYNAFDECNDSKNKGDITPFIHMFTTVILGACEQLRDELEALNERYNRYVDIIPSLSKDKKIQDIYFLLIQAALFSEIGISVKELLELTDVTRATLKKRLNEVDAMGLLVVKRRGSNKFYIADLDKLDEIL